MRLRYHSKSGGGGGETKEVPEPHTEGGAIPTQTRKATPRLQRRSPNHPSPDLQFKQPGHDEAFKAPWTQLGAKDIVPNGDARGTTLKAVTHRATPTVVFLLK